ncbi:MAG: phosphatase PAP2-related protein [Nakamurella sp.]
MTRGNQWEIVAAWSDAWSQRRFRWTLLATSAAAAISPVITPSIFNAVDRRPGRTPPEPLLQLLGPAPVSTAIFALLISTLALVVGACIARPLVLIRGGLALVLLFTLRMVAMTLVPLTAPPGEIALPDPIGQLFYPGSTPETRDLFFSGHTATLVLLIALVSTRRAKMAVAAVATTVGVLLLVQHAHWTVDVLAAPLFAAAAWRISGFAATRVGGADSRAGTEGSDPGIDASSELAVASDPPGRRRGSRRYHLC